MGLLDKLRAWGNKPASTQTNAAKPSTDATPAPSTPPTEPTPHVQEVKEDAEETPEHIAERILQLLPYIRQYRQQGMADSEIVELLTRHAWPEYIVRKALKHANA